MGSSGGSWFPESRNDPEDLAKKARQTEADAQSASFESEVAGILAEVLSGHNDRDTQAIQRVLERVREELGEEIGEVLEILFGGSVGKNTFVNGVSDVDALVEIKDANVSDYSPNQLLNQFADRLRSVFGGETVEVGSMAVTLSVAEERIQLLPMLRSKERMWIPTGSGNEWSKIRPRAFTAELTKVNQDMNGKVVPTIKLVKGIIASWPEQRRLAGYHVEALATRIFGEYSGSKTPKAMVEHFFDQAPAIIKSPMQDSTGQSRHLDAYLGNSGSLSRRVASDALERVGRQIKNANGAGSTEQWRRLSGAGDVEG